MSQEAQEPSLSFDVLTWIEENKSMLKVVIGGSIVLVAGLITFRWYGEETRLKASEAVVAAAMAVSPTNDVPAQTWIKLAEAHAGTAAGERALLLAATQLFSEGKYAEAEAKFDAFLSKSESPFVVTAALGKASALDAQNKLTEAAAAYQNVITRFPNEPLTTQARIGRALILEAQGQFAQALATYDESMKSAQQNPLARKASQLRDALLMKHPELATTSTGSTTNSVNVVAPAGAK